MSNKQDTLQAIIGLLNDNGFTAQGEPDDFGAEFKSKAGDWQVRLTASTFSCDHVTNKSIQWAFGPNTDQVRGLLKRLPNIDPDNFVEEPEDNSAPAKAAKKEKKAAVKAQKVEAKAAAKADKAPSARGTIFAMLKAGKNRKEILDALIPMFPERDSKSLNSQIYLNTGQFRKAGGTVVEVPAAAPEAAPAAA